MKKTARTDVSIDGSIPTGSFEWIQRINPIKVFENRTTLLITSIYTQTGGSTMRNIVAFIGIFILFGHCVAFACDCPQPRIPTDFFASDKVFSGEIVSAVPGKTITFKKIKIYKSNANMPIDRSETLSLEADYQNECNYFNGPSKVGEKLLIFAYLSKSGQLTASLCSRTKHLDKAKEDLEFLKKFEDGKLEKHFENSYTIFPKEKKTFEINAPKGAAPFSPTADQFNLCEKSALFYIDMKNKEIMDHFETCDRQVAGWEIGRHKSLIVHNNCNFPDSTGVMPGHQINYRCDLDSEYVKNIKIL